MWTVDYVRLPELWRTILGAQAMVAVNGLLLCLTLHRAKASGHFSLIPAVLYVAATGVYPYLREHWQPQLIAAILLLFLYATRNLADSHEPNNLVLLMTVLLCVVGLWIPDALWCIAMLWIVVLLQGMFTFRTIVASVLGIGLVGVYYAVALYMGWAEGWDYWALYDRRWIGFQAPACIIVSIVIMYLGFLGVTSGAFRRSSYDLVSTRMLLYHVVLLGLLSTPLILLPTPHPDSLVLLPTALSSTAGLYLLQKQSEDRGVTLLLYIVITAALYTWVLLTL